MLFFVFQNFFWCNFGSGNGFNDVKGGQNVFEFIIFVDYGNGMEVVFQENFQCYVDVVIWRKFGNFFSYNVFYVVGLYVCFIYKVVFLVVVEVVQEMYEVSFVDDVY